jgi:hypothetical protein
LCKRQVLYSVRIGARPERGWNSVGHKNHRTTFVILAKAGIHLHPFKLNFLKMGPRACSRLERGSGAEPAPDLIRGGNPVGHKIRSVRGKFLIPSGLAPRLVGRGRLTLGTGARNDPSLLRLWEKQLCRRHFLSPPQRGRGCRGGGK